MRCGFWNTNGWSKDPQSNNYRIRKAVMDFSCLDVVGIAESHLVGDNELNVPGYVWLGQNRKKLHIRAKGGSGGVGFLISENLLVSHSVTVLDSSEEGLLWIQLKDKDSDWTFNLCVGYLPPDGSTRATDVNVFFDTLLAQVSTYQNDGQYLICGDFNSRCGDSSDFIEGVDDLEEREVVDVGRNSYGDYFVDFMINAECCMLNGRNSTVNDYTFISNRGLSVVDYCLVPHCGLPMFSGFKVTRPRALFENAGCVGREDPSRSIPDHSLLEWTLSLPSGQCRASEALGFEPYSFVKYNTENIPAGFLADSDIRMRIAESIDRLTDAESVEAEYEQFCAYD